MLLMVQYVSQHAKVARLCDKELVCARLLLVVWSAFYIRIPLYGAANFNNIPEVGHLDHEDNKIN